MSEQAKTIGEAICGAFLGIPESVDDIDPDKVVRELRDQGILGYRLIPGTDAVVTEEGLEAGTRAAFESAHDDSWNEVPESQQKTMRRTFKTGLEAAGIEVAEEFWLVDCLATIKIREEDKPHSKLLMYGLLPGDRLYIIRGTEANTSTASTRNGDASKNGAGIDKGD